MIEGADAGGRFALVEHTIAPGAVAAPMHMHSKEDEFTYVLTGTFAAVLGDQEVRAGPGDLVFKPQGRVAHLLESRRCPDSSSQPVGPDPQLTHLAVHLGDRLADGSSRRRPRHVGSEAVADHGPRARKARNPGRQSSRRDHDRRHR